MINLNEEKKNELILVTSFLIRVSLFVFSELV